MREGVSSTLEMSTKMILKGVWHFTVQFSECGATVHYIYFVYVYK